MHVFPERNVAMARAQGQQQERQVREDKGEKAYNIH